MEKMKTAPKKLKPKDLPVTDPWAFLWGAADPLPLKRLTIGYYYLSQNLLSRKIGGGDAATSNPLQEENYAAATIMP